MGDTYSIAAVFTDNMVLQRECNIPVWGKAPHGTKIVIELCGQRGETVSAEGKWGIDLPPLEAGGPYTMTVYMANHEKVFNNILIGDVWLASGQSNMEFFLKDALGGIEEAAESNYPDIRYYDVPRIEYEDNKRKQPELPDGEWKICSPVNSGDFSAAAYYFAKNLYEKINIPIGIIGCNKGGTSASCWMKEEFLAKAAVLREAYLAPYYREIENMTEEMEDKREAEYLWLRDLHEKKIGEFKKIYPQATMSELKKRVGHTPWPPPLGKKSYVRPSGLYTTMLEKVIPYGIKGVIWYQGEEDTNKSTLYQALFSRLIENWREEWGNPKLPFIFVQLPFYNDDKIKDSWAEVREAQLQVMKTMPHTFMVVTSDCGDEFDIHPINKKPIGERLALAAINKVYGDDVNGLSPVYSHQQITGKKIVIYFDFLEQAELIIAGDTVLQGFEICGPDGSFFPAKADIKDNTVEVYSERVKEPTQVRYGWANYTHINLYSSQELPVSPFRTI